MVTLTLYWIKFPETLVSLLPHMNLLFPRKLKYYFTMKDRPDQFESTEELFSYIGGLMGCWLGISVWASVGVFEKIYRKIVQFIQ
ncbi:UNVERIFIED_CONTAM: hypothetical protein NCL1_28207 [Trichonephila clavipes]